MGKVRITAPDGSVYEITAPDDATDEQIVAFAKTELARQGQKNLPEPVFGPQLEPEPVQSNSAGAFLHGLADTATFGLLDEAGGVVDSLLPTKGRENIWSGGGSLADIISGNIDKNRETIGDLQSSNPFAFGSGQVAGAFAVPIGAAARTPGALAKVGGITGAGYGFGSGQGGLTDRLDEAAAGGAIGAATGGILGKLLPRAPRPVQELEPGLSEVGQDTVQTAAERMARAQRVGVDLPLAASGKRGAAILDNTLSNTIGGAQVMQANRAKVGGQVEGALEETAGAFGPGRDVADIGRAAQDGARQWMDRSSDVAEKLYNRIPISPDAQSTLASTRGALDELTSRFSSNDELAAVMQNGTISRYAEALKAGDLSWQDLKAFRSAIGEQIGEMRFGEAPAKSDLRRLYAALSDDMKNTAATMSPQALRAFNRANDFYRAKEQRIEKALIDLIGKDGNKAPEAAGSFIQRISKSGKSSSDIAKLAQVRKSMPEAEWGEVAGSMIRLMGQPANSEGRGFAAETFVRSFDDLAPEAKRLIFGKGEKAKALNEFAEVVRDLSSVSALRNTSNTAGQVITGGMLTTLGEPVTFASVLGGAYLSARMMTSPRFVRWATGLAKMERAKARPQAVQAHINNLGSIAAKEGAIGADIIQLQQRLLESFGQSPSRIAAEEIDD